MTKFKGKEKILREKERNSYLQGSPLSLSADFLTKTLQARRDRHEVFKVLKSKELQPTLPCPTKLLFKIKGKIKNFPDNKRLNQEMLKGQL